MTNIQSLRNYCHNYLHVDSFHDYCPNGLQIEGRQTVSKIVCGVSANLALIKAAIDVGADAIFVHHGFFWKNENSEIIGAKKKRIALLLKHDISLFAYHLPLDAHTKVGNNVQLAHLLEINNPQPVENTLVWQGSLSITVNQLVKRIQTTLSQKPMVVGDCTHKIKKIMWCTGAAQSYIDIAIANDADVYLSGEISEQTPASAIENDMVYISAGHHATERYGVQALCTHLDEKFGTHHQFIDIDNKV